MERSVDELLSSADRDYREALELLDSGDVYDAAEKSWSAIENLRKACLVATSCYYS